MNAELQVIKGAAILLPLIVGAVTTALTIFVHGGSGRAMILLVIRSQRRQMAKPRFRGDVVIIALAAMMMLTAHLLEVTIWAVVLILCGEFSSFGLAFYHSAINYTTLGYGDIVMSPHWRLMGPLEALDGMLLIGITTAALFTVIQQTSRIAHPRLWEEFHQPASAASDM